MSRSGRQRDDVSPSLFPFLAVLLCTMGALVLILMLIVSGAQASARQIAEQSVQQVEEVESQLDLASHGFRKQLDEGRLELEKKRLALQHLESHITELLAELEQLQRTAELSESTTHSDEAKQAERETAISDLEKQLLEASEKLKKKIDKPDGDKPIFAIIPYDGANGTHRRPIYLECVERGLLIQPEGVLLRLEDLEPPYGPGNPLDAALRTIRAQYVPANHAVTSTAYPLLVVRPSGIRTYALARSAMSGWDDQFGYELIGEELELTFPTGEPGLAAKVSQALDLARQRQAALIMAMPQKYREFSDRNAPLASSGNGGGSPSQGYGEVGYGNGENANAQGGWSGDGNPAAGQRGGWADPQAGGLQAGNDNGPQYDQTTGSPFGGSQGSDSPLGFGGQSPANQGSGSDSGAVPGLGAAQGQNSGGTSGSNYDPSGSSSRRGAGDSLFGSPSGAGPNTTWDNTGSGSAASDGQAGGTSAQGGGSAGTAQGQTAGSGQSTGGNSNSGNAANSQGGAGGGNSAQMSGQAMAMPGAAPNGQAAGAQSTGNPSGNSAGSSSSMAGSQGQSASGQTANGSSANSASDPQAAQGMPQLSMNKNFNGQQESSTPVASRRGRGWAWSQGPPSQTSVVRTIHLQCLADRWILLPDSGKANDPRAKTINFEASPQQRAEALAKLIADRVDSWGLALSGGYWKPILVVEVAPDADWRFNQLQQLLDGSGLEVQRK